MFAFSYTGANPINSMDLFFWEALQGELPSPFLLCLFGKRAQDPCGCFQGCSDGGLKEERCWCIFAHTVSTSLGCSFRAKVHNLGMCTFLVQAHSMFNLNRFSPTNLYSVTRFHPQTWDEIRRYLGKYKRARTSLHPSMLALPCIPMSSSSLVLSRRLAKEQHTGY